MGEFLEVCPVMKAFVKILSHDISLVREVVLKNATDTKEIFQSQVSQMKKIHSDIEAVKKELNSIHRLESPNGGIERLSAQVDATEAILERTDSVIKALYGFMGVVQSQDKTDQMLQGAAGSLGYIKELLGVRCGVSEDRVNEAMCSFAGFYTIAEQRGFAMGKQEEHTNKKQEVVLF